MENVEPGLYLVPTPIGNLADITLRALSVLRAADIIAAEDTRHSRKLLNHYEIDTATISYHQHNAAARRQQMLDLLADGKIVALVSDAGTPGLSDPCEDIVRAAVDGGYPVIPLPGASALLPALTAAGLDCRYFSFEGFLPRRQKSRKQRLRSLAKETRTLAIYVAPHHLLGDLRDLWQYLGNRPATLCRELTKMHEHFYRLDLDRLVALAERETLKGEMVLIIAGAPPAVAAPPNEEVLRAELARLMAAGYRTKEAARLLAVKYGLAKNGIYPLSFDIQENNDRGEER